MLLNPDKLTGRYRDDRSAEVMGKTVEFFENRGKVALKRDEHDRVWPTDFLEFVHRERIFATLLTPTGYGRDDCRWDTYRMCEFSEILAFYGLPYWYPFQGDSPGPRADLDEWQRARQATGRGATGGRGGVRVRPL